MREFLDEHDRWVWLRSLGMKATVVLAAIAGTVAIIRDWLGDLMRSIFGGGN